MARFAIGQKVRHKARALNGTVIDIDGDTIYLEADNGVEMQFGGADLEDDAPVPGGPARQAATVRLGASGRPMVSAPPPSAAPPPPNPAHETLLAGLPESVVGQAAVRFAREANKPRGGWAEASATDKLVWVGKVTGLSIDQLTALVKGGKSRQIEAHAAAAKSVRR